MPKKSPRFIYRASAVTIFYRAAKLTCVSRLTV